MLGSMSRGILVETFKVILADDQKVLRQMIRRILSPEHELEVVGEAGDGVQLLHLLKDSESLPDMVILDITMPEMSGIEATREIRNCFPQIKVLILTVHNESGYVSQAFTAGAAGYLLKDEADTDLCEAIQVIRHGGTYRSPGISNAVA